MNNLEKIKSKKVVVRAMILFWVNFFAILVTHNLTGRAGLHVDFSISKYVGLSFPSAIAFLIVNTFVALSMWRYLSPKLGDKIQRILMIYIVITLILLSLFPIGLFDEIIPNPVVFGRTPISFLHVITSRTMFVAMCAFALYTFYAGRRKSLHDETVIKTALAFFLYAVICTFVYIFFSSIFWSFDIIFESLYIAFFFIVVLAF